MPKIPIGWSLSHYRHVQPASLRKKFMCKKGSDAARDTVPLELFSQNGVLRLHLRVCLAIFKWLGGGLSMYTTSCFTAAVKKSYDFTRALV